GTQQQFLQTGGGFLAAVFQHEQGFVYLYATNHIGHQAHLARGGGHVLQPGHGHALASGFDCFGSVFLSSSHGPAFYRLPLSFLLPAWPRKVRVGANSPSLWPTMFSVTYTGTKVRPLCTPMV